MDPKNYGGHLSKEIACKQGAVRAVRFNGKITETFNLVMSLKENFLLFHVVVEGEYCLTCGSDKSVKLWNPYRGALLKTYSGHGYEVLDAQSSCDSRYG